MAAIIYFALLAGVLVFFAAVGKMNRRWENAFDEMQREKLADLESRWRRTA